VRTFKSLVSVILRFKTEDVELRKQGKTNRQVGDEEFDPYILNDIGKWSASGMIDDHINDSYKLYKQLIKEGVARECARMVLPLCTQTTMYMKNSVRNWIHYIDLRTKEDTQKEHRLIAEDIKAVFIENFPIISEALEWKEKDGS
jgi:thymidylate synthase (FAD)